MSCSPVSQTELFTLLDNKGVDGAPVLVLANKQDVQEAMDPGELSQALTLHRIKDHDWHIQASCALTGDGLLDGLGWIAEKLKAAQKANNSWGG